MRFATRSLSANLAHVVQNADCKDRMTGCGPTDEVPPPPCDEPSEPPPPPECDETSEPQPLVVSSCLPGGTDECEPVRTTRSDGRVQQAIRAQMHRAARPSSRRR